jgi:hypothetical protein
MSGAGNDRAEGSQQASRAGYAANGRKTKKVDIRMSDCEKPKTISCGGSFVPPQAYSLYLPED